MELVGLINFELRKRGWSRKELSRKSGIPESTLSLKLAPQKFDTEQIRKIANAFGWNPSELFARAEQNQERKEKEQEK